MLAAELIPAAKELQFEGVISKREGSTTLIRFVDLPRHYRNPSILFPRATHPIISEIFARCFTLVLGVLQVFSGLRNLSLADLTAAGGNFLSGCAVADVHSQFGSILLQLSASALQFRTISTHIAALPGIRGFHDSALCSRDNAARRNPYSGSAGRVHRRNSNADRDQ
jgi:hypothetical protein